MAVSRRRRTVPGDTLATADAAEIVLDGLITAARAALHHQTHAEPDTVVERVLDDRLPLADPATRERLARRLRAELTGLGAFDEWLDDPRVSEVIVNAGSQLWVERDGALERVGELPSGQAEALIERIVSPLGLRLDRSTPIVDARLAQGARLCAVGPPVSPDGTCCSIRRFRPHHLRLDDFAAAPVADLLADLVEARVNLVVAGPTSSGKTSLLNVLAAQVDTGERMITIEDTAELRLEHPHVVRLEARRDTHEAVAAVTIGELVRAALRLRPDRIVVGEVRGGEALDMVQALNTGHDGSMTTCHANSPVDALRRLESMVLIGAPGWPLSAVREQVHSALDVVVQLGRSPQGERRVVAVAEVLPPGRPDETRERVRTLADGRSVLGDLTRRRR